MQKQKFGEHFWIIKVFFKAVSGLNADFYAFFLAAKSGPYFAML
jgi:hypothetical protein